MWLPDNDIEDIDAYLEQVRRRQAELDAQPAYPDVEAPVFNGWEPAPYEPPAYQRQPTSAVDWQVPDWLANDQPPEPDWQPQPADWWQPPPAPTSPADWGIQQNGDTRAAWNAFDLQEPNPFNQETRRASWNDFDLRPDFFSQHGQLPSEAIQFLRDNPYEAGQLGLPQGFTDEQALAAMNETRSPGKLLPFLSKGMSLNASLQGLTGGNVSLDPVYGWVNDNVPGGGFATDVVDAAASPLGLATLGWGGGARAIAGNAAKNLGATAAGLGTDRALSAYGETNNPGADIAGNPWVRGLAGLGAGYAGYEGTMPALRGAKTAGGELGAALRDLPENLVDINTARPRWTPGWNRLRAGALDPETGLPMEFNPVSGGAEIPKFRPLPPDTPLSQIPMLKTGQDLQDAYTAIIHHSPQEPAVFVRWTDSVADDVARGERSQHVLGSGSYEKGLSSSYYLPRLGYDPTPEELLGAIAEYSRITYGKRGFLLTGEVVGKGADGEPLLKNVRLVARVDPKLVEAANYMKQGDSYWERLLHTVTPQRQAEIRASRSAARELYARRGITSPPPTPSGVGGEIPKNLPDGRLNPDWLESRKLDKGDVVTTDDGRQLRVTKDYDPTPGTPGAKARITAKDLETGETVRLPRDRVTPAEPINPPETGTAAKAMEATPAPGIPPGEDLAEKGWKQKILDLLDTEQRHRDAGLVDAEIRQKRLDQLQGMQERRAQAAEMGLTGKERADFIRGGARVGRATAPELVLSDVDKADLFNHVIDNTQGFEYLQAGTAVSKMINGERLHQGEINILRRTLGDEVADRLVARAKPTKGFDALDQAEIAASRKYSDEALARQAKQPQFEAWSEQDLRLKRAYAAQNAAEDARRAANNLKPVNHAPFSRDIATNMARREAEAADQAAKVAAEKAQAAAERAAEKAQAAAERAATKDAELRASTGQRNAEGVARQQKAAREAADRAQAAAVAAREAADREAMKARWKAIGKQNDMDEATLARIASPVGMTPEERTLAQQARWTQLNRAQREAGDLSAALQRTASRESELGRARQMEDLVRKAAGELPPGAESEVRRAVTSWTARTREILDAVDAPSQRSLIGLVQAGGDLLDAAGRWVGGDVPDSFLSHLLHQRNYLTRALEREGMDPEIAAALGRKAEQMFLARKYPRGVPENIQEQIARTRYNPADRVQATAAGIADLSQVAKNSMFGLGDVAVFGVNGLKAGTTSAPAIATGVVNRLLNTLHLGVDTTGGLPRRLAYQLDGVIQGGAGQGVSDFAHDHSLLSFLGRPGRFVDARAYEPIVRRLTEFQYGTVMGSLRNLIHEGNLTIAHLAGEDISSAVARNRLAPFANSATGAAEHALTRNRANVERALAMSPSLRRAQVNQIRAVAQAMVTGTPQEKLVAAGVLFSTGVYTLAMGKYLNDHFGLGDFEMDPSKPGFGYVTVPNPRGGRAVSVDVFPQEQVLKYFGQAARALAEGDPEDARTALAKLGLSSASWPVQKAAQAAGFGFDPVAGGYRLGDYGKGLTPGQRLWSLAPLPPVLSDLINGKWTEVTGPLGIVGLNAHEESPYTDQQQWAQATYGKPWGELTNEQKRLVPPEIKQATDESFADRNPEKAAANEAEKEARGRIEQRYREGLVTAFARYDQADKGDPATLKRAADDLRDGVDNLANVRRAALAEHPYFDNPKATPQDQAVSQWFDTYDLRDPVTGKLNREQVEQAQIELLRRWDDDTRNYVVRMAMGEKTPFGEFEELQKGAVRTGLGGYYDDLKKIAESGFYDAKSRTQFRIDHPETDTLLRKWDVSGSTAKAADAIQEAYAFQAKDDERLKTQGAAYAKEWRDNYQDRARQLGAKLDMAFADNPQSAPRTAGEGLLREFNQKYDSLIDPSTGKLLPGGVDAGGTYQPGGREQIDSWLASRPDVQAAMDARDKRAVTPMVTQYRQDVKTIVNSQYWDVKDMVVAAYTAAKWGTGTKYTSFDALESELMAAARVEARKLIPKDPEAADAFAQQLVDKVLNPMTDLSSKVSKALRESDDGLMTALIRWGYYNPSKAVVEARIKAAPLR